MQYSEAEAKKVDCRKVWPGPCDAWASSVAVGAPHAGAAKSVEGPRSAPGAGGVAGTLVPQPSHAHQPGAASGSPRPAAQQAGRGPRSPEPRRSAQQQHRCSMPHGAASAPRPLQAQTADVTGWTARAAANSQYVTFERPAAQYMGIPVNISCHLLLTTIRPRTGSDKSLYDDGSDSAPLEFTL